MINQDYLIFKEAIKQTILELQEDGTYDKLNTYIDNWHSKMDIHQKLNYILDTNLVKHHTYIQSQHMYYPNKGVGFILNTYPYPEIQKALFQIGKELNIT